MNSCFKFLGVPKLDAIPETHSNKTVLLKYPYLFKYIKRIAAKNYHLPKIIRDNIPIGFKLFFRKKLVNYIYKHTLTNNTYPKISENDSLFLKKYYEQDVLKLKDLTGMQFEEWKEFNR